MKTRKIVTSVRELEDGSGWLVHDRGADGQGYQYESAGEAAKAMKRDDAAFAHEGVTTIRTIEWEPATRIGRLVVKILTEVKS